MVARMLETISVLAITLGAAAPGPGTTSTIMKSEARLDYIAPPELNAGDYTLTLGLLATSFASSAWMSPPATSSWGGDDVDDASRDFFRLETQGARNAAGTASDVLVYSLLAMPLLDAGMVAANGRTGDAARMLVIDLQSVFMTETVVNVTKNLAGRARPYTNDCADDDVACHDPDSRKSFMSGHTARAFTAAGLICTLHGELNLWGGGTSDTVACAVATTAAGTVGILRMMADRHYATDVLGGAAVGILSGFILPRILHFGFGGDDDGPTVSLQPMIGADFAGATAGGTF